MMKRYALVLLPLFSLFMISCAGGKQSRAAEGIQGHPSVTADKTADLNPLPASPVPIIADPGGGEEEDDFDEFEEEFGSVGVNPVFDPLSSYNRVVTRFNNGFFDWVLQPVAKGYAFVLPKSGRVAVNRFFKNLFFPIRFANNFLQLKYDKAAIETGRFIVNTTVGLLGFFDPADAWLKLKPHPEDFGQTLGFYGVGSGFHIVVPFLGPSNLRDLVGTIPDVYAVPLTYLDPVEAAYALETYRRLNDASLRLGEYESLRKDALDLYTFLRDAYERNREAEIKE